MTDNKTDGTVAVEESLITYPTDFPIKAMGLTTPDYAAVVGAAVREILPSFDPATIKTEKSKTGKYTSLTLVVHVENRDQLDTVYRLLTSHPMVKVVL